MADELTLEQTAKLDSLLERAVNMYETLLKQAAIAALTGETIEGFGAIIGITAFAKRVLRQNDESFKVARPEHYEVINEMSEVLSRDGVLRREDIKH